MMIVIYLSKLTMIHLYEYCIKHSKLIMIILSDKQVQIVYTINCQTKLPYKTSHFDKLFFKPK